MKYLYIQGRHWDSTICGRIYSRTGHTSCRSHSSYRDTDPWPCHSRWRWSHTCSSHMGSNGRFQLVDNSYSDSSMSHQFCYTWCWNPDHRNNYRGHTRGNRTIHSDRAEWRPPHSTVHSVTDHTYRCTPPVMKGQRLGRDIWLHSGRGYSFYKCPYTVGQGFLQFILRYYFTKTEV